MITIKVLAFMKNTDWFAIIDVQFSLSNIMNAETKLFHEPLALSAELIARHQVFILTNKKYDKLKEAFFFSYQKHPKHFAKLIRKTKLTGRAFHYL